MGGAAPELRDERQYTHLTTRERDRLAPGQARVACAAALLRWLYAIVTKRQRWSPDIAAGTHERPPTRRPTSGASHRPAATSAIDTIE